MTFFDKVASHDCGTVNFMSADNPGHQICGQAWPAFGWDCLGCGERFVIAKGSIKAFEFVKLPKEIRSCLKTKEGRQELARIWSKK